MTKVINRENVVGVTFFAVGVTCNIVGAAAYVVGAAGKKNSRPLERLLSMETVTKIRQLLQSFQSGK